MTNHLQDLKGFIELMSQPIEQVGYITRDQLEIPADVEITVASDHDTLLESLELLKFKLLNHRQMTGSADYALGYEEACMKVVEMIDGIIRNHEEF